MVDLKTKPFYLNEEQIAWVEQMIAGTPNDLVWCDKWETRR